MKKIYLLSLLTLLIYESNAQTTITLTPSEDVAIGYHDGANTANINFKTAHQCAAFAIPSVATSGGLNVNKGLFKFDLSSIPAGATIIGAQLDLYAYDGPIGIYNGHMGPNNDAYIERVTSGWNENTATWNNQPISTTLNRVYLSGTTNPTLNYLNINVTTLIQDIFTAPTNDGLVLRMVSETATNILAFCSIDYPNTAKHPRLRVSYTADPITIPQNNSTIEIPNVFTPNNDGINDLFSIKSTYVKEFSLQIFNRWGEKSFESTNEKTAWDGSTPSGTKAPEGTYFFFIKAIRFNDEKIERYGTVNLFR